ncbi:MAG: hypothetical protein JSR36_10335 [Proteobacteria bacterium]|nr:hypothetical protein [Pseudomonadota bacterium]
MPHPTDPSRWQAAVVAAARTMLTSRWRHTLETLESARAEQAQLRATVAAERRAARAAARRIQQLEHLRAVLARELRA